VDLQIPGVQKGFTVSFHSVKQKLHIILDVLHASVIRTVEPDIYVTLDFFYQDPKSD
jgi:hypothetical protein